MELSRYDVIVVGAGSVGVPTALAMAEAGLKVAVIDKYPSPGQGENKHAIGGIRATHSDAAKILTCVRSLEIFSTWENKRGDDIEWIRGGYCFPVYRDIEENALKSLLPIQKEHGLDIDFVGPDRIQELIPGIEKEGLIGGTFSPGDGSASPLLSVNAMYRAAVSAGAEFLFKHEVKRIHLSGGKVNGVDTPAGRMEADVVVDAAGPYSPELCRSVGVDLPVVPDSHEGAITEPVKRFFEPMVVDLRPAPGSKNYYFYQNKHGQVVFCITPDPPIVGTDHRETSVFLPQVARRMLFILPRLRHIRVRRVWRGLYPMTPDGSPLVGWNRKVEGLLHATGMCGQGYMIGPGIGEVIARLVTGSSTHEDGPILAGFDPYRQFLGAEALK
ncbi:MAG: FAD-binding oxidoreductase [Candidatus Thermoplasmatota archaeon]|nr:FAD-binding oxidoreductase [Candidatus Thermoplasmatota archaeon]